MIDPESGDLSPADSDDDFGAGLLIHVGMPKTASTWLQAHVFDAQEHGFRSPWGARAGLAIDQFVLPTPFRFSASGTREAFREGLRQAEARGLVPVLSEETLVGDPVSGRYWGGMTVERIHATFPGARVLLCIREQKSMLLSAYKEHVRTGGTFSLERYLGVGATRPGFGGVCQLDALEYDLVIEALEARFSPERVLTLVFEELRADPAAFLGRIADFVGVERWEPPRSRAANVGHRGIGLRVRRLGNRYAAPADPLLERYPLSWQLLNRVTRAVDRFVPDRVHAREEARLARVIQDFVGDAFRESNRRTAARLGSPERLPGFDL